MLKNNKKAKILITILLIILILSIIGIQMLKIKGYYLIHDWIYLIIVYIALLLAILRCSKNKYLERIEYIILAIIFIFSTINFLYVNKSRVVIFKSPNLKNEIIIKEFVKRKIGKETEVKTLDLKRKFYFFARKYDEYPTEFSYRSFSKGTYKIKWITNNIAVVNYLYSNKNKEIKQHVYTFNFKELSSYNYVIPSIIGVWKDEKNPNNTLTVKKDKFIYIKDKKTLMYDISTAKQRGNTAVVFKSKGRIPDLSIVYNENNVVEDTCILSRKSTLFINQVSLDDKKYRLFKRVD